MPEGTVGAPGNKSGATESTAKVDQNNGQPPSSSVRISSQVVFRVAIAVAFVTFSCVILLGVTSGGTFRGVLMRAFTAGVLGCLVGLAASLLGRSFIHEINRRGGRTSEHQEGEKA